MSSRMLFGRGAPSRTPTELLPQAATVLFRRLPPALKLPAEARRQIKSFAVALSDRVAHGRAFTCLLTDDNELRKLNREFLGHDYPTDVLSFPSPDPAAASIGELAISAGRAAAQARDFGHTIVDEIRILMLHGVLHLAGFDHERDTGEMRRAERKWRRELDLPLTLIARSSSPASRRASSRAALIAR